MSTPRWLELLFTLCGLCICSWFYIAAVPANHEYPTVAVAVVYLVWLVYVLSSIGIA